VLEQAAIVECEIGRGDYGNAVGPYLGGVRREGGSVLCGLRAAVDDYGEPAARRDHELLGDSKALGAIEEDPLAGRTHREDAIKPGVGEECHEGSDGIEIEGFAVVS
jgi:hypothetical protein